MFSITSFSYFVLFSMFMYFFISAIQKKSMIFEIVSLYTSSNLSIEQTFSFFSCSFPLIFFNFKQSNLLQLISLLLKILELDITNHIILIELNMPRGGSRSSSRSPPRSSTTASRPQQAPMQQQTQRSGGLLSGIGSTIMQGMAFGAGSEVAHQAVRGVMGGNSHQQQQTQQSQQPQQTQQNPCQLEINNFSECIQRNSDIGYCQNFSDMLKSCKQTYGLL